MKFNSNKVINEYFRRNVFDVYIDYHDELPLVYASMNILLFPLQDITCLSLVILCL